MALVGPLIALPHGGTAPRRIAAGDVVLMDCGCTVEGYQSDVPGTFVAGPAPGAVRRVWDQVAEGQRIAFAAAKIGAPAGSVDDAVRRHYERLGYGPGYRLPGLSHRPGTASAWRGTSRSIWSTARRRRSPRAMRFADEPGLYLPGKFGVRLEDCFHMTASGPKWSASRRPRSTGRFERPYRTRPFVLRSH
ncbi:M24 family metallopeptidase [Sphingomonas sp. MMS24-JH45]